MKERHINIEQPVTNEEFADLLVGAHEAVKDQGVTYVAIFKKEGVEKKRVAFCKNKAILDFTIEEQNSNGYVLELAFEMHTTQ